MHVCDGIVLSSFKFKENERIISVFSKDDGVVQMIAKGISSKNLDRVQLVSPLSYGRFHYEVGRGSLLKLKDGEVIDQFLGLRGELERLETAMRLLKAIDKSQMPGKSAPLLFSLLRVYLGGLQEGNPAAVESSFYLKLLKHEGMLSGSPVCGVCGKAPEFLGDGERFCTAHAPVGAVSFESEEFKMMDVLLQTRDLARLRLLPVEEGLLEKLAVTFGSAF